MAYLVGSVSALGQDPQTPSFPTATSAITVDVVVLDAAGRPVKGLTKSDFTVLEDGRPQTVVGFEAREPVGPSEEGSAGPAAIERVATNMASTKRNGRVFALLVDDLGITASVAQQLRPALARWIRERADPADQVTILTTSGDLWWSDEVAAGRDDLVAVLDRLKGKRDRPSPNGEWMSEVEAHQITVFEGRSDGRAESRAPAPAAGPPTDLGPATVGQSLSVIDRVVKRWFDAGVCHTCMNCNPPDAECRAKVEMHAAQVDGSWTRRAQAVLTALARLSRELGAFPGRKSILLLSEQFLRDDLIDDQFRRAIDASQRGNTAVYFAGVLGLTGPSFSGAENRVAAVPGDIGAINTEETVLAIAGGERLAESTGGTATRSNDLADGLDRMALDSSAYYLLGYQPEQSPDGKWHKLEVKVTRKGVKVRARRGYLAGPAERPGPATAVAGKAGKGAKGKAAAGRNDPPALLAGGDRSAVPLRLASYVQGPDGAGAARVLVTLEIDGGRVHVSDAASGRKASLDLTILAVARDRPKVAPLDQHLDLTLKEADVGGWWALFREVRLPPGVAQVRTMVRDTVTGAVGTVSQRVEIPDVDAPYLSTPLITDKTQPPLAAGEPPRLVPTAHRRFRAHGPLFCQYEVFSFGGQQLPGVAQVMGGYTLQAADGRVVALVPATAIATDGSRVVRRLALPTERLEPGNYELVLTVEDHLVGRTLTARDAFTLDADEEPHVLAEPGSPR